MLENKLIDGIIPEPLGGAHTDLKKIAAEVKKQILKSTKELAKKSVEKRIDERIDKFSKMGVTQ
jgi:acetyl-CoA carboxylase carboxyl transferase subunit alpha